MAYTSVLGTDAARRGGSSPLIPTMTKCPSLPLLNFNNTQISANLFTRKCVDFRVAWNREVLFEIGA